MAEDFSSPADSFDETRERIHRQMLSAVSHDLKTPLATIIGSLEVHIRMEDRLTKEKKDTLIGSALAEAYRLDSFISNILDMAKLEGGMVSAKKERCNLTLLLQDCLTRLGPRRARAEIKLQPIGPNVTVNTDPMLLSRATGLILDNAIKHAGKHPTIDVEYGVEGDHAYIHIRDNGAGIPEGKEEDIFCKYTRFSRTDHQNAGTGLGLAICRQLMALISGTVTVRNHPEGGAAFFLRFPS